MKKISVLRTSLAASLVLFGLSAHAASRVASTPSATATSSSSSMSSSGDFNSLADNDALVEKSRLIAPAKKVEAVQGRVVDLNTRLELGLSYGPTFGGSDYIYTQNMGASLDFHIVPRLAVGARYYHSFNQLTSVGQDAFNAAQYQSASGSMNYKIPAIDYPTDSYLGTVTYSLTYGKINLFDAKVVQFDLYVLGGAGEMVMNSGPTPTYTAGGGMAFWFSQHFSVRAEGRYQTYNQTTYAGTNQLNLGAVTFGIGMLL